MFKKCKTHPNKTSQIILVSSVAVLMLAGCERLPTGTIGSELNADATLAIEKNRVIEASLPTPTQHLACADFQTNQVVTIKGHTQLAKNCDLATKGVQFILDSSNTSLDCNGAILGPTDTTANKTAITIKPKQDNAITQLAVANCHVQGYGHALNIRQKTNPNVRYNQGLTDPEANRALAPQDIRIINVSSEGSNNSGIFVGDHVQRVTFDQLRVARSGTVGLYLEFGSQHNTIQNSVFIDNGFRSFKPNREAIAGDASGFNTIQNNEFIHNGAGSVLLYRNCFEHADDPSQSNHFKRTESARDNIIKGNTFREEPVGVWVASRQSRNLKGFTCGAYPLAETLLASYHIDSAKDNQILGNTFIQVDTGIIVEDDGTQIMNNDFTQADGIAIKIGSEIREKYADKSKGVLAAIQNTQVRNNRFAANKPLVQQIQISAPNQATTVLMDNRTNE
ncbi:right-handed parallel beta-helix repeat-containing protein [Psychrobacter arenosus]|uniref:right-handed parallel beta-helix repeat-containing protein n=1 Tax=Psychrobacter arenosus TaxID=256326 RepID=UPI00191A4582|nr:right-handed parallel beta-helix repeat-containing protein [Psychrobacter arenosus]